MIKMEDMTSKIQTISEKLEQEAKLRHFAYDVGDFFVQAQALGDERFVTLFDKNFTEITKESYDSTLTATETINEFCEKYDFDGVESLINRTAPMLDSENFYYNHLEIRDKESISLENEQELHDPTTPQFAIYRLKETENTAHLKEESLETLMELGIPPDKGNYECIYANQVEEILPEIEEILETEPENFPLDFEFAILKNLESRSDFVYEHEALRDGDVIGLQNQGETTFFYVNPDGLEVIDFSVQEKLVTERTAQEEKATEQKVEQTDKEENDSMKLDIYQKSDKLSIEAGAGVVAYQAGDFFVTAYGDGIGTEVNLYDSNLERVVSTSYENIENLTESLNQFSEDFQFDGIDTLRNHSAELLNYGVFIQNYQEAVQNREQSSELEQQWFSNPEDSFAVYSLNPMEHNEQLSRRGMDFLAKVGEDLDKHNFHCIFTDDLASLIENDPMFYGDTDMEQHFQEALEELQAGDGEKLLTMLEVKSPRMEGLSDELQTGCILSLKLDGEVSNYFMEETGLEKVTFQELPPKFQEKAVEVEKNQFYDELLDDSWSLSDFVTEPISTFDTNCITVLVASAIEMNPESTRKDILAFVGDCINEGDILPKDFRNMEVRDFVGAVVDLDKSQLLEFSSVPKEEQSNPNVEMKQEKTDLSEFSTENLMSLLQEDSNLRHVLTETAELSQIQLYFNEELSVADLKTINHMANMIGTRIDEHEKTSDDILLYISNAVNNGEITASDLKNMEIHDVIEVILADDSLSSLVATENPQKLPDIVPVEGKEDTFQFTLSTQERVAIHEATEHQFDHNFDIDRDYRDILRDILEKIDPNGDLLEFYPDEHSFVINEELLEKMTLTFTEEELEAINESCHEASYYWENIPESYREVLDSIVDKIENKDKVLLDMTMETQAKPENEPRIAAHSYEITDSLVMGGEEIAVGVSPSGSAGTWERSVVADEEKGVMDNWYSGHYFDTVEEAMEDFHQRIEDKLEEREAIYGEKSMYSEKSEDKAKGKEKEGEKTPRESVLAKLKEIKEQTVKKEDKETQSPQKTKPDQTI